MSKFNWRTFPLERMCAMAEYGECIMAAFTNAMNHIAPIECPKTFVIKSWFRSEVESDGSVHFRRIRSTMRFIYRLSFLYNRLGYKIRVKWIREELKPFEMGRIAITVMRDQRGINYGRFSD